MRKYKNCLKDNKVKEERQEATNIMEAYISYPLEKIEKNSLNQKFKN